MALTVAGQNAAADGVAAIGTHLALFNGDPEGAGSELSGGAPAYARKAITYAAASGGSRAASSVPFAFDIPAGATVTHWAIYTAITAGTLVLAGTLTSETFAGQGVYNVNTLTLDPLAS